jgi:hypothetical protein
MNQAYDELRRYMSLVGCPTGVVVVGRRLGIVQEQYGSAIPGTIEVAGEYDTSSVPALALPSGRNCDAGFEFEQRVQGWLESLGNPGSLDTLPEDLRSALDEHVVPWIEVGDVQATGPRVRSAPAA